MTDNLEDRIAACLGLFQASRREANRYVSGDGRVSETDAAELLGWAPGSLKNLRHEGGGPPSYRMPINGARLSYPLRDLAAWVESRREAF